MEPLLEREERASYYRDPESSGIVSFSSTSLIDPACDVRTRILTTGFSPIISVSSVRTLEEAKVAKGCIYMQMPVQEVRSSVIHH